MEAAEVTKIRENVAVNDVQMAHHLGLWKTDLFDSVSDDQTSEFSTPDKNDGVMMKPTFKSALQAKKRLQAFSMHRSGSLPTSPLVKKPKINFEEKIDEGSPPKKTPKKVKDPNEKAKAVIEEIEEIKRYEQAYLDSIKQCNMKRSRSRSHDKERFKKVDKKARNYRRRSSTPDKPRKKDKKPRKYPRNWKEFSELELNFDLNRDFDMSPPKGNNEPSRQLLFESPSLPISHFKMKTANKEDKPVPFEYIRYTRAKPAIPYSVNCTAIKQIYLNRKAVFSAISKEVTSHIEKLHANSIKFKTDPNLKPKSRNWFPKLWRDSSLNECKLLENSVGLSFLQSYTGEDEETEVVEEAMPGEKPEVEGKAKIKPKSYDSEPERAAETKKGDDDKKKPKRKKPRKSDEYSDEAEARLEKRKRKKRDERERKRETDELSAAEERRRKKRRKDKPKKEKRAKEKTKKKKKLVKKKRERSHEDAAVEKAEKAAGEDRTPKRREIKNEKKSFSPVAVDRGEKSRKRKSSDREDSAKRARHEKHRKESDDGEEPSPKKEVKEKKGDAAEAKIQEEPPKIGSSEAKEDVKVEENFAKKEETTPDTDEYHSHWESDEDVSSSAPRQMVKMNRSWESDEELFERTYNRNSTQSHSYDKLEIPLNIQTFCRRTVKSKWDEKPPSYRDMENEMKLLEEERRKLEVEMEKAKKRQEETDKGASEEAKEAARSSTPDFDLNLVKKEKVDAINEFNIDSLNNSLLSTVSSVESSSFPIAALENEYEEFIKAVSSDSSSQVKKKVSDGSSSDSSDSSTSSSSSSDSDRKRKKRKAKKKRRKGRDFDGFVSGTVKNIFDEFDIPVPSDLPEVPIAPIPVPVPCPVEAILPPSANLLFNSMLDLGGAPAVADDPKPAPSEGPNLPKPFVFSSITLPSKKPLLDNSKLKLDDDSDSADFTDKFVKKPEIKEPAETKLPEEATEDAPQVAKEEAKPPPSLPPLVEEVAAAAKAPVEEAEKAKPKRPTPPLERKPSDSGRERRRSKSRERESRRRSPPKRRESSPHSRRRYSPRRRSPLPPRRRPLSPRRRSPSPRRRTPSPRRRSVSPRRRSLTPRRRSLSPRRRLSPFARGRRFRSPRRSRTPSPRRSLSPRPRGGSRKRTPSPRARRGTSPLNSPLDGFKRSVADSTISDDMLPQPNPEDYMESPPAYGSSKYYDRKMSGKRSSLSPLSSPKRISLDDRINLVLGLEKNEPKVPTVNEVYANYGYGNPYEPQYGQYPPYGQYGVQKNDYMSYGTPYGVQPPPPPPLPVAKPVPTPTKVVQVGNILQVVPTEEIPPAMMEPKQPQETAQKIVQVGNMLQIVPAVLPVKQPVVDSPQPPMVQVQEKQSAEAVMKQKNAERKAEREKRRQERERRRKEKEKKRKEKEKRKQMKLKLKTENMIKRALQLEAEALMADEGDEEADNAEAPVQWPPVQVIVSATAANTPSKGILIAGGFSKLEKKSSKSEKRKSVQFADGVRPGEGTSPSGGEELSSPPPVPAKLPKEKRYKKMKLPKKSKKKKIKVKVIKKVQPEEDEEEDDEEDNLPPPSPPPGSPPPHVFPSRVKTHTMNNVHQFVGNIVPNNANFVPPYRPQMPMVINRGPHGPGYMPGPFHSDVHGLSHPSSHNSFPGSLPNHGVSSHH